MSFFLAIFIIDGILFGAFCAFVAGQKNRSKEKWFWLGFLFSFLALLALIGTPKIETPQPSIKNQPPCNPDLSLDQYKIWLTRCYKIEKNEALGGIICDSKIFPNIENALEYADLKYRDAIKNKISTSNERNSINSLYAEVKDNFSTHAPFLIAILILIAIILYYI